MMHLQTESTRRWITVAGLAAAALSAAYWTQAGLSASRAPTARPVPAQPVVVAASADELARVLGAPAPLAGDASLTSRFRLAGVLARSGGLGAVLLSVDGQPARTFSVGAELAPGFMLQTVGPGEAMLAQAADGPVLLTLRVPALAGAVDSSGTDVGGNPTATSATSASSNSLTSSASVAAGAAASPPPAQAAAQTVPPPSSRRPAPLP